MYLNYLQILIKIYESKIKKKKDKKDSLVLLFLQKNKKTSPKRRCFLSEWPDSNGRPLAPHARMLADCTTPRNLRVQR